MKQQKEVKWEISGLRNKNRVLNIELMNNLELVGIRIDLFKNRVSEMEERFGIITVVLYERDQEIKAIRGHVTDTENIIQFHTIIFSICEYTQHRNRKKCILR